MLNPTPPHLLTDAQGRPYFLWDSELTLEEFRCRLASPELEVRAYYAGKLMRQAKPDDVFEFLSAAEMRELWPHLERYLGHSRPFWSWLLERWEALDRGEGGGVTRRGREPGRPLDCAPHPYHPKVLKPVTLSGALGDDAKHYQIRAVKQAIEESKS